MAEVQNGMAVMQPVHDQQTTTVVVMAPGTNGAVPVPTMERKTDWTIWSWISCCIFGQAWCAIPAIIFANGAKECYNRGEKEAGDQKSRYSLYLNIGALVAEIICIAVVVAVVANGALAVKQASQWWQ